MLQPWELEFAAWFLEDAGADFQDHSADETFMPASVDTLAIAAARRRDVESGSAPAEAEGRATTRRQHMKRTILTSMLALAGACSNAGWAAQGLCAKGETVFFSCPVQGGKLISLCGNIGDGGDPTGAGPWLQYRYGRAGTIELGYPTTKQASLAKFKGEHVLSHLAGAEMTSESVSFVSGGIGYRIESTMPESRKLFQGVSVGDPRKFDLPVPGRPRASYPDLVIPCTAKADTAGFRELIEQLGE
jgi:hypothetical protein